MILVLLLAIGVGLTVEAFAPGEATGLLPELSLVQLLVAVASGLAIGLISSLLGVAGGEVIIPTLLFVFRADIVVAGTVSLLISLPTVTVGVARHARRGSYQQRDDRTRTIETVDHGAVTTTARIRVADDLVLTSSITLDAANDLGLKAGDEVTAIIKSSDVIVGIEP